MGQDHAALPDSLLICEVGDMRVGASVFRRKFAAEPPLEPHHVVALYRDEDGALWPASYVHFRPWNGLMLVGGACTDGRVLRRMPEPERRAVQRVGGVYLHVLRWAFRHFGPRCEAFFGYCGDARAMEVDLEAGFVATPHRHLIVHWHRPLGASRQQALIQAVHALGPF